MTDFWTAGRIEIMRVMHHRGASSREIGLEIGCSRNAVIGKLHRLGIVKPSAAEEWSPEDLATLKRMHMDGAHYSAIAAVLGRTTTACQNKASRIGLPSRGHNTIRRSTKVAGHAPRGFQPRLVEGLAAPSLELATDIVNVTGCRWAVTPDDVDRGAHLFCNHPTEINEATGDPRPYCPYHSELNRAKPVPKAKVKRFVIPTTLLRVVA